MEFEALPLADQTDPNRVEPTASLQQEQAIEDDNAAQTALLAEGAIPTGMLESAPAQEQAAPAMAEAPRDQQFWW